ncbi:MAG: hypothetical protein HY000_30340 [Planctomycetes bacterium]|nr:hypothetical protein [Planctomycetota bacterium]
MTRRRPLSAPRLKNIVTLLLAILILVPSLWGFGSKFLEFVAIYRGEVDGAFAISPILNYLLASLGFLLLFGWAIGHGMFRDIERPKFVMLVNERRLDRLEAERLRGEG